MIREEHLFPGPSPKSGAGEKMPVAGGVAGRLRFRNAKLRSNAARRTGFLPWPSAARRGKPLMIGCPTGSTRRLHDRERLDCGAFGIIVLAGKSAFFGQIAAIKNCLPDCLFGKSPARGIDSPGEIGAMEVTRVAWIVMKCA